MNQFHQLRNICNENIHHLLPLTAKVFLLSTWVSTSEAPERTWRNPSIIEEHSFTHALTESLMGKERWWVIFFHLVKKWILHRIPNSKHLCHVKTRYFRIISCDCLEVALSYDLVLGSKWGFAPNSRCLDEYSTVRIKSRWVGQYQQKRIHEASSKPVEKLLRHNLKSFQLF